jgi:alpha-amylase/alpha-mannosidase (GH57 family)
MTELIIHGHFYQPPRENPWTGEVEREPGAEPFHDWNERIHAECYAPNAAARIYNGDGEVAQFVNNYELLSFNVGPTLFSWLERHHPETYKSILAADRVSASRRCGHGNAIAQAYGHAILPLCNSHDRLTQVVWGLEDFRFRFRREAEALWLPETACNDATLAVLIEQGLRYVILAPSQAESVRLPNETDFSPVTDQSLDTAKPYRYLHPDGSGRSIAIFFYDGPASRGIAFEHVLNSSRRFVDLLSEAAAGRQMISVATDGETYGHHFKFGELCLAHALEYEAPAAGFMLTNYGEFLDRNPPTDEVRIQHGISGEGSSWSCVHGVARWIRDCGCGSEPGWNQQWRTPLRTALEFLRDDAARYFEEAGADLFSDPWRARNDYIHLLLKPDSRSEFLHRHGRAGLSAGDEQRGMTFLEMQHYSLLMFTSCGWFFSDIGGIESGQVMKYAARVLELMEELRLPSPRTRFLEILSEARSNVIEKGSGADIFLRGASSRNSVECGREPAGGRLD